MAEQYTTQNTTEYNSPEDKTIEESTTDVETTPNTTTDVETAPPNIENKVVLNTSKKPSKYVTRFISLFP